MATCSLPRCLLDNSGSMKERGFVYVSIYVLSQCRAAHLLLSGTVDLSIQFIGAFNRVRGIWFVDDVDDSSTLFFFPLERIGRHARRHSKPLLPVPSLPHHLHGHRYSIKLRRGVFSKDLRTIGCSRHRTYMANKEKRFVVSETTSCTGVPQCTLDKGIPVHPENE